MGGVGVDEEGLRGSSSSAGQVFEPAGGKCGDERRVCLRAWLHVCGGAAHSVVPTRFLLRWSIVRPRTVDLKVLHCQSGKRGETANHHSPDLYEPII